jgi:hypothetical protein
MLSGTLAPARRAQRIGKVHESTSAYSPDMGQTWRHRVAEAVRLLGVALMIVIAAAATYLEWAGSLDMALLPYFLAFSVFCVAHIIAMVIENGRNFLGRKHKRTW